jgi:hypothetical protein
MDSKELRELRRFARDCFARAIVKAQAQGFTKREAGRIFGDALKDGAESDSVEALRNQLNTDHRFADGRLSVAEEVQGGDQ